MFKRAFLVNLNINVMAIGSSLIKSITFCYRFYTYIT